MRWRALWWFLPDEALPLVVIGGALLVIMGVIKPGKLLLIVFGLALMPLLGPVFDAVFDLMPWWLLLLVFAGIAISTFRGISALFIGDRASDHMVGALATDVVRGVLRLAFGVPVALVRALSRLR